MIFPGRRLHVVGHIDEVLIGRPAMLTSMSVCPARIFGIIRSLWRVVPLLYIRSLNRHSFCVSRSSSDRSTKHSTLFRDDSLYIDSKLLVHVSYFDQRSQVFFANLLRLIIRSAASFTFVNRLTS